MCAEAKHDKRFDVDFVAVTLCTFFDYAVVKQLPAKRSESHFLGETGVARI